MALTRPSNTYTKNVINWGIDDRLPLGFVDIVIDKETGSWLGYMKGDNFYPLGVDAAEYDAKREKSVDTYNEKQKAREERQLSSNPIGAQIDKYTLTVTTDPSNGNTYLSGITPGEESAREHFIYVGSSGQPDVTPDFDVVRKKIISDIQSQPGSTDIIFEAMYSAGLISRDTFNKRDFSAQDFNKGLQYAIRNYSINAIDAIEFKGAKII
jgi:hypothetical protein